MANRDAHLLVSRQTNTQATLVQTTEQSEKIGVDLPLQAVELVSRLALSAPVAESLDLVCQDSREFDTNGLVSPLPGNPHRPGLARDSSQQ